MQYQKHRAAAEVTLLHISRKSKPLAASCRRLACTAVNPEPLDSDVRPGAGAKPSTLVRHAISYPVLPSRYQTNLLKGTHDVTTASSELTTCSKHRLASPAPGCEARRAGHARTLLLEARREVICGANGCAWVAGRVHTVAAPRDVDCVTGR